MHSVLKNLPGVQHYLDDIIVYGHSKEEHDEYLQAVLQCLKDVRLQINFGKSSFGQTSILFLGHVISMGGLHPSPDHLTAIAATPAPMDIAALRSFLGLTSWFSKFIPNYATAVEPLRELRRTNTQAEIEWTDAANESFNDLKTVLLKSPKLAIYNPELPTFITTDASDYGLGADAVALRQHGTHCCLCFPHPVCC